MLPNSGPRSWWFADALTRDEPEPMSLTKDDVVDVAIVGGGYTGLWTALALNEKSPSLSMAVLESGLCGAQASGKNGGVVHGYWTSLHRLLPVFGDEGTAALADAGSRAQQAVGTFCQSRVRDVWWSARGLMKVSTTHRQDGGLSTLVQAAHAIGHPDKVLPLSDSEVQSRCSSPRFRAGVFIPEAATVHPARLALELRAEVDRRGGCVFENTTITSVRPDGDDYLLVTPDATLRAKSVVLATNSALVGLPQARPHLTNFSSFAVMTEPVPELLRSIGWVGGEGIVDSRMFLHYFRTTPDGRVLMGTGSGPIGFGTRVNGLTDDAEAMGRAIAGVRSLLPALRDVEISAAWGGPIDVSSDHLPFFGTIPDSRIYFGCGYSGHGVNAAWIGGQVLASLVLRERNEWTESLFCKRTLPSLPPEPFRYLGGRPIRSAILSCEEAEERGEIGPLPARAISNLPKLLRIRVGTR